MTIIVRVFTGTDTVRFTASSYRAAVQQLAGYAGHTAKIYAKSGDGVALIATLEV